MSYECPESAIIGINWIGGHSLYSEDRPMPPVDLSLLELLWAAKIMRTFAWYLAAKHPILIQAIIIWASLTTKNKIPSA